MKQSTKDKKNELIVIVVSAILVAFLTNFLASYFYETLHHKSYIVWVIVGFCVLLISSVVLLYSLLLSNAGHNKTTILAPITFSRKEHKFIDLPFNFLSVQTRVYFNKLPVEGQIHLATYDNWNSFFNSELHRFLNQSIQASVISRILTKWKLDNRNEESFIDSSKIATSIKENLLLKDWFKEEGKIFAPFIENLSSFGTNSSFLEVKTKYGIIKFTWAISYLQTPYKSKYFLGKDLSSKDFHDFEITMSMTYQGNIWKTFSSGISRFYEWSDSLENLLQEYDWKSKHIDRVLVVLKELRDDLGK